MIFIFLYKCKMVYGLEVDGVDVYIYILLLLCLLIGIFDWLYKYIWIGIEYIIFIDNM